MIGEIRLFPYAQVPDGWHVCDGTLLSVQQYQALFTLLGVNYGGNGSTTFGLPDLRGRTPVGTGNHAAHVGPDGLAYAGGAEAVTLLSTNMPQHNHALHVTSSTGTLNSVQPVGVYAGSAAGAIYAQSSSLQPIDPRTLQAADGGNGPHSNMQPFAVMQFCICMNGYYPQRP